jgi:hypothetical protein
MGHTPDPIGPRSLLFFTFKLASGQFGELLLQSMDFFGQTADDHVDLVDAERPIRLMREFIAELS